MQKRKNMMVTIKMQLQHINVQKIMRMWLGKKYDYFYYYYNVRKGKKNK